RTLAVADLHLTQQEAAAAGLDAALDETRLKPGEVIVGYRVPLHAGERSAYVKVRERASYEYALVAAAAVVVIEKGRIARAAVALGSVAQKAWRLHAVEAQLIGKPPTREAALPILITGLADARPLAHNGYKVAMAARAATRAIVEAAA